MKRLTVWMAIGIGIGTALHDSLDATIIGMLLAFGPFLLLGVHAVITSAYEKMWSEIQDDCDG